MRMASCLLLCRSLQATGLGLLLGDDELTCRDAASSCIIERRRRVLDAPNSTEDLTIEDFPAVAGLGPTSSRSRSLSWSP